MSYSIKEIESSYATEWLRLRNLLWEDEDHWSEIEKFFAGELDEPNQVLLVFDDQGLAVVHVELSIRYDVEGLRGIKTGYIEGMFIDQRHRSPGLAMQLLRASERWAANSGCSAFASDREDRIIIHQKFIARTD